MTAINPLLISLLEPAINRYLSLDQNATALLEPLAGKVIAIDITSLNQSIYLCPTQDHIQILESYPDPVDARLIGSLAALGLMGLSATPMRSLFKGEVRIEGDTQIAHKLQSLFAKLDIDLESKLARYTGPGLAGKLSEFFRGSRAWSQDSLHSLRLNIEEFLQEETRELPAKAEADALFAEIDTCRNDFDRLNSRIERLIAAQTSTSQPNS